MRRCSARSPASPRRDRFRQEVSSVDKLPPSSGSGVGDRGHRSADLHHGAWRDWLAGPVDALDARVKEPDWIGRGGEPSQVIRPGSPLPQAPIPSEVTGSEIIGRKATQLLSPRRHPRRRCDRRHEVRALRQGSARRGGPSNPQTSRTGAGAHERPNGHRIVWTEEQETPVSRTR